MIDLTGISHNQIIEDIVDVLCNKTSNTDRFFYRIEAAYFLSKMAAAQRVVINTKDRGEIPVNTYAICLAQSGFGKGHSVNIMETEFINGFKNKFKETFEIISEKHLHDLATDISAKKNTDFDEEFDKILKDFNNLGEYPFTFDSGTTPAVKQLRTKLLMGNVGSINLQIDEIGSNLEGNTEVLNTFLELYDQGLIKQKLTKNTHDNKRSKDLDGKTPTNMLLFGTPTKLFDGHSVENAFYSFLETGYARRCLFAYGQQDRKAFHSLSPEEAYKQSLQSNSSPTINKLYANFTKLGEPAFYNWKLEVPDEVGIKSIEYRFACEKFAESLADHQEIQKAELSHRFFKAMKLAGALAFADMSQEITLQHLMEAILLVEESGKSFETILNREKSYQKLAKYIASAGVELTHADLTDALPFYKTSQTYRNEQLNLATAWGYKNNILIKKSYMDNIELIRGETLKETNLDSVRLSYSDHYAYGYEPVDVPFDALHQLTQEEGMHWANHHFVNNHRCENNVKMGFNLIVIDIDGTTKINIAQELLKEYNYLIYTTKSHTEKEHRFRIILPINYYLELDSDDYREFMESIYSWLPFKVDDGNSWTRSKKWESYAKGSFNYNLEGVCLDALQFIPKTSKNEDFQKERKQLESLDNLERWFAQRIAKGNRNNNLLKFALCLVDSGMDLISVQDQVISFNKKLSNPLTEDELRNTIFTTVAKRY